MIRAVTAPSDPPPDRANAPADERAVSAYHTLPVGTVIGGFEINGLIGEGGFGIVYRAFDPTLHRQVALKEYMPSSLASRGGNSADVSVKSTKFLDTFNAGLRSFINEARLLASFDHPSLVKVHQFWQSNRTAYMVMPYYQGPTLKAHVRAIQEQGRAPDEATLRGWLMPLLDALAVIHREQCYHRDIAPDNILLTPNGPLLLDFGAARRVISDMTQALTVILKPGFAPIEQYGEASSMVQGPWTDLYALASVIYLCITGRPPITSVERVMGDPLPQLANVARGRYSEPFLKAIDAALAVKPGDRPQSVVEFRALLAAPAPEPSTVIVTAPRPAPVPLPAPPLPRSGPRDANIEGRIGAWLGPAPQLPRSGPRDEPPALPMPLGSAGDDHQPTEALFSEPRPVAVEPARAQAPRRKAVAIAAASVATLGLAALAAVLWPRASPEDALQSTPRSAIKAPPAAPAVPVATPAVATVPTAKPAVTAVPAATPAAAPAVPAAAPAAAVPAAAPAAAAPAAAPAAAAPAEAPAAAAPPAATPPATPAPAAAPAAAALPAGATPAVPDTPAARAASPEPIETLLPATKPPPRPATLSAPEPTAAPPAVADRPRPAADARERRAQQGREARQSRERASSESADAAPAASLSTEPAAAAPAPAIAAPPPAAPAATPTPAARATRQETRPPRCAELYQKGSQQPLSLEEAKFLRSECR